MSTSTHRVELFGAAIDGLALDDVVALCDEAIARRRRLLISVVNAAKLVKMRDDHELRAAVESGDICVADGMSVVWAVRVLGERLPERVAGIDLMHALLKRASACGHRVYLLGAEAAVVARVAEHIREELPGVQLVGWRDGYFRDDEAEDVARTIGAARPDILLVAMTSPRKERFLATWGDVLRVPVCHGVGGSFDVVAGKVQRAPVAWQRLGLEWLYRVKQEPRRLWRRYLVTNSKFLWWLGSAAAARWLLGQRLPVRDITRDVQPTMPS